MTKSLGLLLILCTFQSSLAFADLVVGTEEETQYIVPQPQVQAEEAHVSFKFADLIDTGTVISKSALMSEQVASDQSIRVDAPPEGCRIYKTHASFYSTGSHVAYKSRKFDKNADTMATLNLRLGEQVFVRMPGAKQWVQGVANDRGPYVAGRGADLSIGYAKSIGFPLGRGHADIQVAACKKISI